MQSAIPLVRRAAVLVFLASLALPAAAREGEQPTSFRENLAIPVTALPGVSLDSIDRTALLQEDMDRAKGGDGAVDKRLRIGVNRTLSLNPRNAGRWETLADGSRLWRLRIQGANATDLRFGFTRFAFPDNATLYLVDVAGHTYEGPYARTDATPDGQLWLPVIAGSDVVVEARVPAGADLGADQLTLGNVAQGYRNVTERGGPGMFAISASGACNIDTVCPLGDLYRNEIRSVARMIFASEGGSYYCTGSLVMNTARDFKPYFLTANHCISTQAEATSLTLVWNYQSPSCGAHGGGSTAQSQTGGSTLRSHRADVDVTLLELNQTPPTAYNVYFAGWDASGVIPTSGSIGVHHPSGDVKAITETNHALTTMNSCIGSGGVSSHWRTGQPYSQGTTEGGSSGSAIFVPSGDASGHGNLIIGTLSGGSAACSGAVPNAGYDCYGKFSVAWDGASAAARLKDWLDPTATGATTLAGGTPSDVIFKHGFDN